MTSTVGNFSVTFGVINRKSYDFSHLFLLYGLCCYILRTTLQKWHLDSDQSQTMNVRMGVCMTITPLVRHFIEYNLSASSAFTISFCHSSSAPLISFTLSISPTSSLFSHLSRFYLFSLSLSLFLSFSRREWGKRKCFKDTARSVTLFVLLCHLSG